MPPALFLFLKFALAVWTSRFTEMLGWFVLWCCWGLDRDFCVACSDTEDGFGGADASTAVILPVREHGVQSHPPASLASCSFQYTCLSPPCLNVFLGILFFLTQL